MPICERMRKLLRNHLITLAVWLRPLRRLASAVTISGMDYDFGVVAVVRSLRLPHTGEGRAISSSAVVLLFLKHRAHS